MEMCSHKTAEFLFILPSDIHPLERPKGLCILPLLLFRLYTQVCEINTADCNTNHLEHIINSLKTENHQSQHAITKTAN